MSDKERQFPIMVGRVGDATKGIPWRVIAPFDARAKQNHGGQSLEELARRGGLDCGEALAVLNDVRLFPYKPATFDELLARVAELEVKP